MRRAYPYREFDAARTLPPSSRCWRTASPRGAAGAVRLIHHDAVNGVLRGRRGTRLTAITSGGTIPDNADYQVLLEPEKLVVGTVNEDFAVESTGRRRIPARQHAPTASCGSSAAPCGSRMRMALAADHALLAGRGAGAQRRAVGRGVAPARARSPRASDAGPAAASTVRDWLMDEIGIEPEPPPSSWWSISLPRHAALGSLPTQETIVLERFFDEAGGMQLVIHSPYGSRINRAWGLALRKRFCRKFNFELQAAATEDNIVLSLTTAHSFELAEVVALSAFGHACGRC